MRPFRQGLDVGPGAVFEKRVGEYQSGRLRPAERRCRFRTVPGVRCADGVPVKKGLKLCNWPLFPIYQNRMNSFVGHRIPLSFDLKVSDRLCQPALAMRKNPSFSTPPRLDTRQDGDQTDRTCITSGFGICYLPETTGIGTSHEHVTKITFRQDDEIRSIILAAHAQLSHFGVQCGALEAQPRSGTVRTCDQALGFAQGA